MEIVIDIPSQTLSLIGGDGDDIFVWKQGDAGGEGLALAAKDVVADFGNGHDVLDLADLLQLGSEVAGFLMRKKMGYLAA